MPERSSTETEPGHNPLLGALGSGPLLTATVLGETGKHVDIPDCSAYAHNCGLSG